MLDALFGSHTAATLLLYLNRHGECYTAGAAREMCVAVSQVQRQLDKFVAAGLVVSRRVGNQRFYSFNPKLRVTSKLKALLSAGYQELPPEERDLLWPRQEPRP